MESDESGEDKALPDSESDSDFQDSDDALAESCESDEESENEDEAAGDLLCDEESKENRDGRNEMPTKKVKIEHPVPNEQIYAGESNERCQKRVKTERYVDDQTRISDYSAYPMITLSSDNESRHDGELQIESNPVASSNLKVVFDVEYEAPE